MKTKRFDRFRDSIQREEAEGLTPPFSARLLKTGRPEELNGPAHSEARLRAQQAKDQSVDDDQSVEESVDASRWHNLFVQSYPLGQLVSLSHLRRQ